MNCPKCTSILPSDAAFCPMCGTGANSTCPPLPPTPHCPTCDSTVTDFSRFCGQCGTPLGSSGLIGPPSLVRSLEERRQVTVLHADIVGFTELSERLDPEGVKKRLDAIFNALISDIVLRGGTVDKLIGDAVLALFGAPEASGNDAIRAVEAALAMHETLSTLDQELNSDDAPGMSIRVGIESGLLVVGRIAGAPRPTVTGSALFKAIALESKAPIGGVVVGSATYKQIRGAFNCRPLDGVDGAWVIEGKGKTMPPLPFLGRGEELKNLLSYIQKALNRSGPSCLTVTGHRGMGKSRLVMETLGQLCASPNISVVIARSSPLGSGPSQDIIAQWSCQLLENQNWNDGSHGKSSIHSASQLKSAPLGSDAQALALAGYLNSIGKVVLVAEDHQWCRPGARRRLEFLREANGDAPICLLTVERTSTSISNRTIQAPTREHAPALHLKPLGVESILALFPKQVVGEARRIMTQVAVTAGGGRPLSAAHLHRLVIGMSVDETQETSDIVITWLKQVVQARLDDLGPQEQHLIRTGAVIGTIFWDDLLALLGVRKAKDILENLVNSGFLERREDKDLSKSRAFSFSSELVREIAYQNILIKKRRLQHQVIANWLSKQASQVDEKLIKHHQIWGGKSSLQQKGGQT